MIIAGLIRVMALYLKKLWRLHKQDLTAEKTVDKPPQNTEKKAYDTTVEALSLP